MSDGERKVGSPAPAAAVEENLRESMAMFARRAPAGEVAEDAGLARYVTGIPLPECNAVFTGRLEPEQLDAAIRETLQRFTARGLPLTWWIGPAAHAPGLGEALLRHGFAHGASLPGMTADAGTVAGAAAPPDLAVREVEDPSMLREWQRPFAAAFGWEAWALEAALEVNTRIGFGAAGSLRHFTGYLEGAPVACSSLFLGARVAGIYDVAVLPDFRRRGIGTAMTVAALHAGRAAGFRTGILHASPMGEGAYRRLGFKDVCRLEAYTWQPPPSAR